MKPMKKRNAITVAALASLGFGGAATAAVSATHADASATDHGSSSGEVSASDVAQKPSKPKVVKVYIDEPAQDAAASAGSSSGTGSNDSFAAGQDDGLAPVTPTPTAPRQPATGKNHDASNESPGTAESDEDHGAGAHAEEPTTTVAPPTTTSGGSGNAGTEDHEAEDHEDHEDHEVEDHGGDDD